MTDWNSAQPPQGNPQKPAHRITLRDVARICNTSVSTVSRVLNDRGYPVNPKLKEQIKRTADKIGYAPNLHSQLLRGAENREIGVIVPSIFNPFYGQLVSTVEAICLNNGYITDIYSSYNDPANEQKHIRNLCSRQVSGIILSSIDLNPGAINFLKARQIPLVLFDQSNPSLTDCDQVCYDFAKGTAIATEYLIKTGHRRICFVTAPLDRPSRKDMTLGIRRTAKKHGLDFSDRQIIVATPNNAPSEDYSFEMQVGKDLAKRVSQMTPMPDALIAMNDMVAIALCNELQKYGLSIPADLSIIGLDNIVFAELVNPRLTTISQPAVVTGRSAIELLMRKIEGERASARTVRIEPQLIIRETVRDRRQ